MQGDGDQDWDAGYSQRHIDRCMAIVDAYLATVGVDSKLPEDEIRAAVKKAVLDLNAVNEKCEGALLETDQREDVCQLLLVGAKKAGLRTDDDITEEWREW